MATKVTVIIPSLEYVRPEIPRKVLEQLQRHSERTAKVHWINNNATHPFRDMLAEFPKVLDDDSQPNLFINPAWNYGMSKVETEYWALLNDDILFHGGVLDGICDMLDNRKDIGLTTCCTQIMYDFRDINWWLDANPLKLPLTFDLKNPWKSGWFMVGRTEDWIPCPLGERLDIYHGDDHIYECAFNKYGHAAMVNNNTLLHAESTTTRTIAERREFMASISKEGRCGN